MQKDTFLIDDTENQFARDISFKNALAGKLWFNSKRNANPLFKELKGDYKKKLPEPEKKESKPEDKKGEDKKGENKQEDKKGEDKKEDKKEENKKEEEKKNEENKQEEKKEEKK